MEMYRQRKAPGELFDGPFSETSPAKDERKLSANIETPGLMEQPAKIGMPLAVDFLHRGEEGKMTTYLCQLPLMASVINGGYLIRLIGIIITRNFHLGIY